MLAGNGLLVAVTLLAFDNLLNILRLNDDRPGFACNSLAMVVVNAIAAVQLIEEHFSCGLPSRTAKLLVDLLEEMKSNYILIALPNVMETVTCLARCPHSVEDHIVELVATDTALVVRFGNLCAIGLAIGTGADHIVDRGVDSV